MTPSVCFINLEVSVVCLLRESEGGFVLTLG